MDSSQNFSNTTEIISAADIDASLMPPPPPLQHKSYATAVIPEQQQQQQQQQHQHRDNQTEDSPLRRLINNYDPRVPAFIQLDSEDTFPPYQSSLIDKKTTPRSNKKKKDQSQEEESASTEKPKGRRKTTPKRIASTVNKPGDADSTSSPPTYNSQQPSQNQQPGINIDIQSSNLQYPGPQPRPPTSQLNQNSSTSDRPATLHHHPDNNQEPSSKTSAINTVTLSTTCHQSSNHQITIRGAHPHPAPNFYHQNPPIHQSPPTYHPPQVSYQTTPQHQTSSAHATPPNYHSAPTCNQTFANSGVHQSPHNLQLKKIQNNVYHQQQQQQANIIPGWGNQTNPPFSQNFGFNSNTQQDANFNQTPTQSAVNPFAAVSPSHQQTSGQQSQQDHSIQLQTTAQLQTNLTYLQLEATNRRQQLELDRKIKECDNLTGILANAKYRESVDKNVIDNQKQQLESQKQQSAQYKEKVEIAEQSHHQERLSHQAALRKIIRLEEELKLAKEEIKAIKGKQAAEKTRLQQNHDVQIVNSNEELRIKIAELESAKRDLADIKSEGQEEFNTRLIEKETEHKTELIKIKSTYQEALNKRVEDLRLQYEERIEILKGRINTHDKHYENWVHQIRALESETEKAKENYEKQIDGLKSDVKSLQTQQEGYEQLLEIANKRCKILTLQVTYSEKLEAEAKTKTEEYNNELIKTKAELHKARLELFTIQNQNQESPKTPLRDEEDGNGNRGDDDDNDVNDDDEVARANARTYKPTIAANSFGNDMSAPFSNDGATNSTIAAVSARSTISNDTTNSSTAAAAATISVATVNANTTVDVVGTNTTSGANTTAKTSAATTSTTTTSAAATADIKPNLHLIDGSTGDTPTEDYNESPSTSVTEGRETNHDKMVVDAIMRASTTIDVEAIKDILRQTTDRNKFPITTANTGNKTTYKLGSVGYGILNGAITPTGNTVSPAFTRACKKQWIINCLNGNEIIGDIRDRDKITELMRHHGIRIITTQQGRCINECGHVMVDDITYNDDVNGDPDWQPDNEDTDTKYERDSTSAVFESGPIKKTTMARKLQQNSRNKQTGAITSAAASQSERVSANDSKPVGKTEPIDAELHHHHPNAEQIDKPTTKMPKLSFKRKKNATGKCGKRKQANIDSIREKAVNPDNDANDANDASSTRKSAAEPAAAATASAATTANTATAGAATSASGAPDSGSSIWSKFKQLGSARQNPSSSNLEANNEGINLEMAKHRIKQNDDAWLADQIYKQEGERRRSPRATAGKKYQRH